MTNRKKVIKEPRLVAAVPTHIVSFNTIAWPDRRPEDLCFWLPQRGGVRTWYGFASAASSDEFYAKLTSGSVSIFPPDAERRTFASREEAQHFLDEIQRSNRASA
jgi:hypothetical protein